MNSFLYEGTLYHQRFATPRRTFEYSLFMVYLDLGELESVFAGRTLWSASGPNIAWFRRADHHGDRRIPLADAIRALVCEQTGKRPEGPIRLLTHLRYFGYGFNPVSFYYCFDPEDRQIETIVAEVSNTPWGEQHVYVLPRESSLGTGDERRHEFKKAFHVSPFLPMETDYSWSFGSPGEHLWVKMENRQKGEPTFLAKLSLTRRPIDGIELARALLLRPAMTLQVVAAIYFQALCLWLRRATFYSHPRAEQARQHEG
jgi:uncharacterized protein